MIDLNTTTRKWMRLAVLNFVLVALAGVALRYKLTFPFPQIDFKNLLHAHSHFAFAGWISTALFVLLINQFVSADLQRRREYRVLFVLSQFTSFGMLFSFLIQEYGPISIAFSTANIFVSYGYAYVMWQHTKIHKGSLSLSALRASLIFLIVSSLGPFALGYIVATHMFNSELLHNAIYWYLHFQYNGWFSFAVFALVLKNIEQSNPGLVSGYRMPLRVMLIACIPTYLLSIIWTAPPLWLSAVAGFFALSQLIALLMVARVRFQHPAQPYHRTLRLLLSLALLSFAAKLALQFLSAFPSINQFVFGHRPVIIAYLHLVMLGFVSFFIIASAVRAQLLHMNRLVNTGILIFILGVFLNETGLTMQGFSGIPDRVFRWIPMLLYCASIIMMLGIALLGIGQLIRNKKYSIE